MRVDPFDLFVKAAAAEPTEFGKVVLFSTLEESNDEKMQKGISKIFEFCDDPDLYLSDMVEQTLPVILWDKQSLIEKYGITDSISHDLLTAEKVYNAPYGIISDKKDMIKLLKKLNFPWLSKKALPKKEVVDFRLLFFRGKNTPITLLSVWAKEEDITLQVNPFEIPMLNVKECYHIAGGIFDINPTLNIACIDISINKEGKHFFIDVDRCPAFISNTIPAIYKCVYEDYYGRLSEYAIKRLMQMCTYFVYVTKLEHPSFKSETNICTNVFGYRYK